jgi:Protein of unknown function (DUF2568)
MTAKQIQDQRVGVVGLLSFCCELAMLVLLAVAGWSLGTAGATRLLLAVVLPAAAIAVWAVWMAPTSRRRLADPARLVAQIALFAVVGVLLAWSGHSAWGISFAIGASVIFALTRLAA